MTDGEISLGKKDELFFTFADRPRPQSPQVRVSNSPEVLITLERVTIADYAPRQKPMMTRQATSLFSIGALADEPARVAPLSSIEGALLSSSVAVRRDAIEELVKRLKEPAIQGWVNKALADPDTNANIRSAVLVALRGAVDADRRKSIGAYYAVPTQQPALAFLSLDALVAIVEEVINPRSDLASRARTLVFSSLIDRRMRGAFAKAAIRKSNPRYSSCVRLYEAWTYYNWAIGLVSDLAGYTTYPPQPQFGTPEVNEALVRDLRDIFDWAVFLRTLLTTPYDRTNSTIIYYGGGFSNAILGGDSRIRLPSGTSAAEALKQTLREGATRSFTAFLAEAATLPDFDATYLFPHHRAIAQKYVGQPSLSSLALDGDPNPAEMPWPNCSSF